MTLKIKLKQLLMPLLLLIFGYFFQCFT